MYEKPVEMELGVRPHVSLAVFPNLDPESIREDILAVSRELATFTLRFSSIGQFDTEEGVVYLSPARSDLLTTTHRHFHRLLMKRKLGSLDYYRPDQWIPHCTIATGVPSERMHAVTTECSNLHSLGRVRVVRISCVQYRPLTEVYYYPLGDIESAPS